MKAKAEYHILYPIEIFEYGGVSSFVKQYTKFLKGNNYKSIILGREGNIDNADDYFFDSEVFMIPGKIAGGIIYNAVGIFKYLYFLNKIYIKYPVDIVHFSISLSSFFCLFHPMTWKKTRIITFYGASHLEYGSRYKNKITYVRLNMFARKFVQNLSLRFSHRIITFSQYSKDLLIEHFNIQKDKIKIIPGAVTDTDIITN